MKFKVTVNEIWHRELEIEAESEEEARKEYEHGLLEQSEIVFEYSHDEEPVFEKIKD